MISGIIPYLVCSATAHKSRNGAQRNDGRHIQPSVITRCFIPAFVFFPKFFIFPVANRNSFTIYLIDGLATVAQPKTLIP